MRYGCVSPTPEMEDVDHSDSELSDASFEIVSADGIDEPQTTPPSFKPCIKFHDIFDVYPMDADVVARVSTSGDFKISSDDKVVVVPLAWSSVDQAVCVSKLNGLYVRFDVNELPKAPADQFYQLCYCTAEGSIVGVSTPFFFREVHEEDLMEFQKEQNKEFWTFRSRFAVLTDLYWNAIKNNGTTRPDEMIESCGATKDSETTEKSSVEDCSANKDAEAIDESLNESKSSIQVSETLETSATDNCSANQASEITVESIVENQPENDASETTKISPTENRSVIEDESTEQAPAETKRDDSVQPQPVCVNQEPIIDNQEIPVSSEKEQNNIASPMESKPLTESTNNVALNAGAASKPEDEVRAKRFMDVGDWKLLVNDSFYDRKQKQYSLLALRQGDAQVENKAGTTQVPTLETKLQDLKLWRGSCWVRPNQYYRRYGEENSTHKVIDALLPLSTFQALHETIVGRLILSAMRNMSAEQLKRDLLLSEARRPTLYDQVMHKNSVNVRMPPTNHTQESGGPVSQTILSLTSRIETQAVLMQDLKRQLANESKTIDTLKAEYLTYKRDMETRLKHCAKIYAKLTLKLRHFTNEGRK